MICEKCGAAYVSENCPRCEDSAIKVSKPEKERTGIRKMKKATIAIIVLALVVIGLVAMQSILKISVPRAEEKAKEVLAQYINDEITAQMQALYPELTRTDILILYSVVDETETEVNGDIIILLHPEGAELHIAKALSYMRTYMNVAKENGVTDMAIITNAIREQYKAKQAVEAAEKEAKAAADEARMKLDNEQAQAEAEKAQAKAEEAQAEAEAIRAMFGVLGDALQAVGEIE